MIVDLEKLITQLEHHEGVKTKPYVDTQGKLTIGVGRNLTDKGLHPNEIRLLLLNDIKDAMMDANAFKWFEDLNEIRQRVVVDMLFNLGRSRFMNFRKMIVALNKQDFATAADEMLDSRWAKQVGRRAQVLSGMMRSGEEV
jgi:lysozyme